MWEYKSPSLPGRSRGRNARFEAFQRTTRKRETRDSHAIQAVRLITSRGGLVLAGGLVRPPLGRMRNLLLYPLMNPPACYCGQVLSKTTQGSQSTSWGKNTTMTKATNCKVTKGTMPL